MLHGVGVVAAGVRACGAVCPAEFVLLSLCGVACAVGFLRRSACGGVSCGGACGTECGEESAL